MQNLAFPLNKMKRKQKSIIRFQIVTTFVLIMAFTFKAALTLLIVIFSSFFFFFGHPHVLNCFLAARYTRISQFKNHGDANICTMRWSENLQTKIKALKEHRETKTRLDSKNMKCAQQWNGCNLISAKKKRSLQLQSGLNGTPFAVQSRLGQMRYSDRNSDLHLPHIYSGLRGTVVLLQ